MPTNTAAAILGRVIEPDEPTLSPEAARSILKLTFRQADQRRVSQLVARNQEGLLSAEEREELEEYLRVNDVLNLLKAKARLSLKRAGSNDVAP
jgi:hypothetical protein